VRLDAPATHERSGLAVRLQPTKLLGAAGRPKSANPFCTKCEWLSWYSGLNTLLDLIVTADATEPLGAGLDAASLGLTINGDETKLWSIAK
jgi:hypothetical protein